MYKTSPKNKALVSAYRKLHESVKFAKPKKQIKTKPMFEKPKKY